jgi:allophanate hydrolase
LPLNGELLARGGRLVRACRTAPVYRLYALAGGPPRRPGLLRDTTHGAAIEVEEWALPRSALGDFMAGIPAPLAIGRVELEDGSQPHGFLCEAHALQGAEEITRLGGWRAYLAQR